MIVVDTHALIWDALAPERLSATAQQALVEANAGNGLLICDISLWEIAMLVEKGRVQVDADCQSFINLRFVFDAKHFILGNIIRQHSETICIPMVW